MSQKERIGAVHRKYASKIGGPGIGLLVVKNRVPIYSNGIGMGNIAKNIPLSNTSLFDLASVSKHFTVVALMMLEEEELVGLKDEVRDYIPDFPKRVTISQLIWHTSGIYDYTNDWDGTSQEFKELTCEGCADWVIENGLETKPGKKHSYNNSGYVILARIIEVVSEMPFDKYMQKKIFGPLGMKNTFCFDPKGKTNQRVLTYTKKNNKFIESYEPSIIHGDGNIFTCMPDFVKWENALRDFTLITEESWDWMCSVGKKCSDYGGGLEIGENSVSHTGAWAGAQNTVLYFDQDDITFLLLGNSEYDGEDALIEELMEIFDLEF